MKYNKFKFGDKVLVRGQSLKRVFEVQHCFRDGYSLKGWRGGRLAEKDLTAYSATSKPLEGIIKKPIKKPVKAKFSVGDIVTCAGQQNWGHVVAVGLVSVRYVFKGDSYVGSFTIDELEAMSHATNFDIPEAHRREYNNVVPPLARLLSRIDKAQLMADLANAKAALDTMVKRNNELEQSVGVRELSIGLLKAKAARLQRVVDFWLNGKFD
jgi:hypothetical protein